MPIAKAATAEWDLFILASVRHLYGVLDLLVYISSCTNLKGGMPYLIKTREMLVCDRLESEILSVLIMIVISS